MEVNSLDKSNSNFNGVMAFQKSQNLTEKQMDKVIEQNGQAIEYTNKERMQELEKHEIMSFDYKVYLLSILIFLFLLFIIVAWFDKSLLNTAIAGIFGLLGGLGIGYGVGKNEKDTNQ